MTRYYSVYPPPVVRGELGKLLDWFEVTEIRGSLGAGGAIERYQVALMLGFRMEG